MNKGIFSLCITLLLFWALAPSASAAKKGYIPGIKILLEVRTPQGELRTFQRPGDNPTYWTQDFPIVQGDKVVIAPLITTGEAELEKVRIRLDNVLLSDKITPPWRQEFDTKEMTPGYHQVEVWAQTKLEKSGEKSVNVVFLVVPASDTLLQMLQTTPTPSVPVPSTPEIIEADLACTIRSTDAAADKTITELSQLKVDRQVLLFIAAPTAKEFFYTLTRGGQVTYTSPRLPLLTHILLEPQKEAGVGLAPGEAIFTVRAGDGQGHFGPPVWITLEIAASEQGK